jgi:PAS domain S-box-containing protein
MPKFSALEALDVLKRTELDVPFIIVSGTVGEESAVDAMHAGAHDYVLKDKLGRLLPAVERELRECRERAALRESEVRSAAIVRCSSDAIVATDHNGRVIEFNPAAEKCFGYSRAEALGQSFAELVVPERARETFRARLAELVTGAASALVEKPLVLTAKRKDGTEFPVARTITRLDGRSPPIIMGFIRDISERAEAEARRVHAEEALRQSEAQLRQAQKMEAVGRLAGGVAHDFNNVLSVIMSYGELILSDLKAGGPLRTDIEEIRKAASRAAG